MLRATAPERDRVENSIRHSLCDLDTETNTRGGPYALMRTKNQATYERRVKQRTEDLADLASFRA